MSDDMEYVRANTRMPRHLRDAAKRKAEHGELSEKTRELYRRIAYGEDVEKEDRLKQELQEKRDERDEKKKRVRELQADIENLESDITRLEEQVENRNARRDKYEGMIEMLEALLEDGTRVFPEHGQVKQAASMKGIAPQEVIDELKERHPDIPEKMYKPLTAQEHHSETL